MAWKPAIFGQKSANSYKERSILKKGKSNLNFSKHVHTFENRKKWTIAIFSRIMSQNSRFWATKFPLGLLQQQQMNFEWKCLTMKCIVVLQLFCEYSPFHLKYMNVCKYVGCLTFQLFTGVVAYIHHPIWNVLFKNQIGKFVKWNF